MHRHPSLIPLSHDHREGLFVAKVLKRRKTKFKDVPQTPKEKLGFANAFFYRTLQRHFGAEEDVLLPAASGQSEALDALLADMLREHAEIREMFTQLEGPAGLEERLDRLGHALEAHIRTEERQLFEAVQDTLSEQTLHDLGIGLQEHKAASQD